VRLPRVAQASEAAGENAEPRPLADGRLRILVVEDNDDAREMLRTLLDLAGHETYEAADGPEGLRLATELKPQVALVDLGLPGFDGLELAGRIRAIPGGDAMELVALTGYGQMQDRQRTGRLASISTWSSRSTLAHSGKCWPWPPNARPRRSSSPRGQASAAIGAWPGLLPGNGRAPFLAPGDGQLGSTDS
jgi:CheY-like chemotaxis protein